MWGVGSENPDARHSNYELPVTKLYEKNKTKLYCAKEGGEEKAK